MDLPIFYNEEEEWKKVMLMYDSALKEVLTKLEILNNEFKLNHQYNPIEHITSRIKLPQSIAKKMRHNKRELTVENIVKYINDVAGIRIICSFTSDIYRIADLLAKQNDVNVLKIKDYIMCPKPNGYTSYHMIISVPVFLSNTIVNTKVEIQIRTIAMDFWASLEHKIYYKFEGNAPERIRKELKECADVVAFLDHKMLSLNEEVKTIYHDNRVELYKEAVSENFQNMIKDSYGTVVDDEVETDNIIDDTINTSVNNMKDAIDNPIKDTLNTNHVFESQLDTNTEQVIEIAKDQRVITEMDTPIKNTKAAKDSKGKKKDTTKRLEGKTLRLFGFR